MKKYTEIVKSLLESIALSEANKRMSYNNPKHIYGSTNPALRDSEEWQFFNTGAKGEAAMDVTIGSAAGKKYLKSLSAKQQAQWAKEKKANTPNRWGALPGERDEDDLLEDLQTPERSAELRRQFKSAVAATNKAWAPGAPTKKFTDAETAAETAFETNDDEKNSLTSLYGKGGKVIEKFKPKFFKGLDKIGQEIWSIGPKYYVVAWTHDIYKPRTKETTRSTEVLNSSKTGRVNYGGDPIFYLDGWHSGKAIMAALLKSDKDLFK